ncbi:MAG TPA: hypothetical protein VJK05_02470, partial [archaeon]|nr:hypothetical protein [archaeon]
YELFLYKQKPSAPYILDPQSYGPEEFPDYEYVLFVGINEKSEIKVRNFYDLVLEKNGLKLFRKKQNFI